MTKASNLGKGGSNFDSSGVLGVAGGGTGATTQAAAANAVLPTQTGNNGKYLTTDGTNTSWGTVTSNPGTVTSVAATVPSVLSISGSPITSSGTLAIGYSGTALPVANGGTGLTTTPANGALDIGNGTGFTRTTLTQGSGISITNGAGSITIAATGGGTVTSVATGNGLQGGTITTSGTLSVACPTFNTVGSYCTAAIIGTVGNNPTAGGNYSAGSGSNQVQALVSCNGGTGSNILSGTWKWMGATNVYPGNDTTGTWCRVA